MNSLKRFGLLLTLLAVAFLIALSCGDDKGTEPNNPPDEPTIDVLYGPGDGTHEVSITLTLHWNCDDIDGDRLTYDVYFGINNPPPLVNSNQSGTSYSPDTLEYDTTYYWRVVAKDEHGATTDSKVWHFTTREPDLVLANVTSTETDIALVLKKYRDDEKLVVLADKTSNGHIATVTGGAYVAPSGGTCTFWFGDDGLPSMW